MVCVRLSGSDAILAPDSSKKHAPAAAAHEKPPSPAAWPGVLPVLCQRERTPPPGSWELHFHISNPSREFVDGRRAVCAGSKEGWEG